MEKKRDKMKINIGQQHGKAGINNLILITQPKGKTELEIYQEKQKEILRGIFE